MTRSAVLSFLFFILLPGCSSRAVVTPAPYALQGQWVVEANGQVMLDPQTSGLSHWRGYLLTIADGSADISQQRRWLRLLPGSAAVEAQKWVFDMQPAVETSCFREYLTTEPDYEAIVVDPDDDRVFYLVTEDASRTTPLSGECAERFGDTGSTDYPTLLVRLQVDESRQKVSLTHVRPLYFAPQLAIGDFPNDGIEGLAMGPDRTLYLGLEKDAHGNARILSVPMDPQFWQSSDFIAVQDPGFVLPSFNGGRHPINGLEHFAYQGREYLLAVARNDDELWLVDIQKRQTVQRINLQFMTPPHPEQGCISAQMMDNASLEGVAVVDGRVWLINDPWKVNYLKNVQCEGNRARFERMAPLLFNMPLDPAWFQGTSL
ncbi:hypothetical protein LJ739_16570 [Aestuariibacter halophilus]|uniref:Phytase-like domain-containing protein n=1 Tax=Fluctibacter halophilus TaxID=226011 RepID=A0ABS8GBU5_9ALTE|nr:hypothetical protein [Aestuariibacter halophilus]MCC2617868.1 hypothetical protein [Aestuariibacter halophilus]